MCVKSCEYIQKKVLYLLGTYHILGAAQGVFTVYLWVVGVGGQGGRESVGERGMEYSSLNLSSRYHWNAYIFGKIVDLPICPRNLRSS